MALVLNDRVKETTTTTGTGAVTLGGAVTGFDTFSTGVGNSNTTYYAIVNRTVDEWEVGLGTLAADSSTLTRTTVLTNSDGNTSAITLSAGTKEVFCTEPASKTMDMTLTTTGDTLYASAANTPARLAVGSARQVLQTNSGGTLPEWVASPQSILTGQGDLLYTSAANTLARLAAGTGSYHLTMNSGGTAPEWTEVAAGIEWQSVQTSSPITGAAGKGYPVNTTSGAITLNLPAGVVGEQVAVVDYAGTFDTNALTISANSSEKIKGSTNDVIMETERQAGVLTYVDATQGWVLTSAAPDPGLSPAPLFVTATGGTETTSGDYKIHTFNSTSALCVSCAGNSAGSNTVDYMVIAGGGGGAGDSSGGGGAGGWRASAGTASGSYTAGPSPLTAPAPAIAVPTGSSPYTVTVGGGGPAPYSAQGADGGNSVFSSITSTGGGGAGHPPGPADACKAGADGGSGGGSGTGPAPLATAGSGNTPPTTPPQGQNGTDGNPYPACSGISGGGGGAGGSAPATTAAYDGSSGIGGVGVTSCISASPVKYAGGGGGAANRSSNPITGRPNEGTGGGPFGGGFGGTSTIPDGQVAGTAGGTNLGGGGGGGASNAAGKAGGSGIVIIRYKYQ
jgi:hypothetical protein